jgi:hypothetical protein
MSRTARNDLNYPDGAQIRLGDRVQLWPGVQGTVVCSLDTEEFSDTFPKREWDYLRSGVMISSPQAGLIHFLEAEASLRLIERADHREPHKP